MSSMPRPGQASYDFSKQEFDALAAFALTNFGLCLPENKMPMVYTRLCRRLRERGVSDFETYRTIIEDPSELGEREALLSALTTNVTRFFREPHHFDTFSEELMPSLISNAKKGERVRIWSAGCSTGPEPYSIAMNILEKFPDAPNYDVKILGTDIDPKVIEKAKLGSFARDELEPIPATIFDKHVVLEGDNVNVGNLSTEVKKLITFGVLNLIEPLPFSGPFDAIFCRNVAIYFDKPTQSKVWSTLSAVLKSRGYLFMGHSERLSGPATEVLVSTGITTYQKS